MAIDPNIILQARGPQFDSPLDVAAKAMTMRQLAMQGRAQEDQYNRQKAVDEAYRAGVVTNPDGTASFDQARTLSGLAKVGGKEFLDASNQFRANKKAEAEMNTEQALQKVEIIARLTGSATDQRSYESAIAQASKLGLDVSQMPSSYDPQLMKSYQAMALTAKEQLDNKLKQEELGIKRQESASKAKAGESLPIDKKKSVETLATKNATKLAIKNQIDAVMENWDSLSADQKVASGRQLLKTLNSTEGADAIGVEEANRLGSMLEFAVGNFTNSNPTQFGRDLEGFKTQALNTSKSIGSAVSANQKIIDQSMGRKIKASSVPPAKTFKTNEIEWAD